jgi:hypothetical protein
MATFLKSLMLFVVTGGIAVGLNQLMVWANAAEGGNAPPSSHRRPRCQPQCGGNRRHSPGEGPSDDALRVN